MSDVHSNPQLKVVLLLYKRLVHCRELFAKHVSIISLQYRQEQADPVTIHAIDGLFVMLRVMNIRVSRWHASYIKHMIDNR